MKKDKAKLLSVVKVVVIVAGAMIAYVPAMRGGFVWNDNSYVHKNRLLSEPTAANLGKIWTIREVSRADGAQYYSSYTEQYYPMVFTSFWIEANIWGNQNPTGFHVVNVLLHIANALLVWLICRRLGIGWGWLAGAIFALHPMAVESVAWITERKNVLSGLFYLLAMLSYLRFERERRWWFYVAAMLCFVLGLLSKTVVCTLPAVLVVILWAKNKKFVWAELGRLVPFFAIGAVLGLFTAYLEKNSVGAVGAEWQIAFWQRFIIAGKAVFFYAGKLLWPTKLSFIYPRWEPSAFSPLGLVWPVAVAVLGAVLWWFREAIGQWAFAVWACFVITLLPALGFVDVYPFRFSFVADHFAYLGSIYFVVMCVWLIHAAAERVRGEGSETAKTPTVGAMVVCVLLLVLGGLTYVQAGSFKDMKTLWEDTTEKNPKAWMAWNNLGEIYVKKKDFIAAGECFKQAIAARANYAVGHCNYGQVLAIQGDFEGAIEHLLLAIKSREGYVLAHLKLANMYAQLRRYELAIAEYETTIRLAEKSALGLDERNRRVEALIKLAGVYAETGRYAKAAEHMERAIELSREYGYDELSGKLEERLKRYQQVE